MLAIEYIILSPQEFMSSGDDTEMYKYWEAVAWLICMNVALEAASLGVNLRDSVSSPAKWNNDAHFHSYYFLFSVFFYWPPLQDSPGMGGWGGVAGSLTLADGWWRYLSFLMLWGLSVKPLPLGWMLSF